MDLIGIAKTTAREIRDCALEEGIVLSAINPHVVVAATEIFVRFNSIHAPDAEEKLKAFVALKFSEKFRKARTTGVTEAQLAIARGEIVVTAK